MFISISDISGLKKSCNYWLLVKIIISHCCVGYDVTNASKFLFCFITVAVSMFQVASSSSDDILDENYNSLSSKQACQLCRENGLKQPSGCAIETCFGCLTCSVQNEIPCAVPCIGRTCVENEIPCAVPCIGGTCVENEIPCAVPCIGGTCVERFLVQEEHVWRMRFLVQYLA